MNMDMKKGSAVVMVTVIIAYVLIVAVSLAVLISGNTAMYGSLNDMEGAYYICEAGMERMTAIVNKDICSRLEATSINSAGDAVDISLMKPIFDRNVIPYFSDFKSGIINEYEKYIGDDGKGQGNGRDTVLFSTFLRFPSYYSISSMQLKQTRLDFKDNFYIYEIKFEAGTSGSTKNAYREINAKYTFSFFMCFVDDVIGGPFGGKHAKVQSCDVKITSWQY